MPKIWGDERATRQIVLNLLSNSIKFTPHGGEIWLKVGWTASGGQYLSVKDTGSGIAEDEIPIVLASFGQGSNSIKSAEQGAGLGLPIAKSLIDMHGGTFTLKSKLRIGTEVIVTFPPERVMSALAPMAEEAPPLQPETTSKPQADEKQRPRNKPIMSAGTGLVSQACLRKRRLILHYSQNEPRNAVHRSLPDGPQDQPLLRVRTHAAGNRGLAPHGQRRAARRDGAVAGTHGGSRSCARGAAAKGRSR